MPRNPGTGVYVAPIANVVTLTTVASTPYNVNFRDVETDLNTPRPIVAGGTGATNAVQARANIGAEVSSLNQVVTNYDSQTWESGSFMSIMGATAAPTGTEHFSGVSTLLTNDQQYITLRAVGNDSGIVYERRKEGGFWGLWARADQGVIDLANSKVAKAGDIMSGSLTLTNADPSVYLNKTGGATHGNYIFGTNNSVLRWALSIGDGVAESGGNNGSDVDFTRYTDAGAAIDTPFTIRRATGVVELCSQFTVGNLLSVKVGYKNSIGYSGIGLRPDTDPSYPMALFNSAGTLVGTIATTSTTTTYNTSSSADLKEDLKTFDASRIIDATNVYDFAWKSTKERAFGVLAQQAKDVYPAAVTHDETSDWWGIDYSKYVPVLLNELKALRARVAQLEASAAGKPA